MLAGGPLVSVIIPAYNAEAFVQQTLSSVIAQTYRRLEILVVDDGSKDSTPEIVETAAKLDNRIRLLRQRNEGVATARNMAIHYSSGELIAPLDADDIWYPEKIARQVECLQDCPPEVGVIYTWSAAMAADGSLYGAAACARQEGDVFATMLYQNFIGNASVPLIRRACINRVGGYDAGLRAHHAEGCEDWDLTLRLAEHYRYRVVPEFLVGYRQLNSSMSSNSDAMARSYFLVLEQFRRRRQDIPACVYRWSAGHFCLYLMWKSYLAGDFRNTLKWIIEGVRYDPALIAAPMTGSFFLRSLMRLCAQPLTSAIWPTREDWLRWKSRFFSRPFRTRTLSQVIRECGKSQRVLNPYELLALRRMRRVAACCHCHPAAEHA
jgi:glycosyltransferase involved in cell wall biosynthesis